MSAKTTVKMTTATMNPVTSMLNAVEHERRRRSARPRCRRRTIAGADEEADHGGEPIAAHAACIECCACRSGKLLVANRGEIAVRVFRTCRELGIETVAVVAPDDAGSLHARSADETRRDRELPPLRGAHPRGDARRRRRDPPRLRLPRGERRLRGGGRGGRADLGRPVAGGAAARRRQARGEADRARGRRPRRCPTGTPDEIGFPLLVKAAAGGGGRGMRVVRSQAELDDALAAAEREAAGAFGDGTLYCERYLERPRHVEVQLLADAHGTVVALGERDCSVQRRHQKVLEESPAPRPRRRAARGAARRRRRVRARDRLPERRHGRVRRRRATTFFFLELNGRIQVEHPVTEAVTGLDLVAAPDPHRRRRAALRQTVTRPTGTRSRCGSTPRIRARSSPRPAGSSGSTASDTVTGVGAFASTRASRRATRSGSRTTR